MSDFTHIVITNDGEIVKLFENGVFLRSLLSADNWTLEMWSPGERADDSAERPRKDGDIHPTAKCITCGDTMRYWSGAERYPDWGWICNSWWHMEGGCPFPEPPIL